MPHSDPDVVLSIDGGATSFLNTSILDTAGRIMYNVDTFENHTRLTTPAATPTRRRTGAQPASVQVASIRWPQRASHNLSGAVVSLNGSTENAGRFLNKRKLILYVSPLVFQ